MELTAAAADWAQTEWEAGRLTYEGNDSSTLGSWAEVTSAGGLDGLYSFNFGSNVLSLAVVPEPSTFALLAGMLGFTLVMLRRR